MTAIDDTKDNNSNVNDDDSDSSSVGGFANIDFVGVNFDGDGLTPNEETAVSWERCAAFQQQFDNNSNNNNDCLAELASLARQLQQGQYVAILAAEEQLWGMEHTHTTDETPYELLARRVVEYGTSGVLACIELEWIAVAALNLFLQANYTGPALDESGNVMLSAIYPHACFDSWKQLQQDDESSNKDATTPNNNNNNTQQQAFHNAILAELAVDGDWPVQVCQVPYFFWLARTILSVLSGTDKNTTTTSSNGGNHTTPSVLQEHTRHLTGLPLWLGRTLVAHERLLESRDTSHTLWTQTEAAFAACRDHFVHDDNQNTLAATVWLEWGLAQHHFQKSTPALASFRRAQKVSGLQVEVTGSIGKRTKYQQNATAQMIVRAESAAATTAGSNTDNHNNKNNNATSQGTSKTLEMVQHGEDGILLEKIRFEKDDDNQIKPLNILDQSILMAMCLNVKDSNAADELTAEEMGAYLARVLDHHDDWMVYSTALLERAWLEFERSHARERAILQIQALVDQHTNRLTITQSTLASIEQSAPVQDRLVNLHAIVYPPRWTMIQDLADRYANLGIVTSAAELYTDIEYWSDAVDCYRRGGKLATAEAIVRARLQVAETPRMWQALGDITQDPAHYHKAIQVSHGRYSSAHLALGAYYFDVQGDLVAAADHYQAGLQLRPLVTPAWFRLGTISMQLERWEAALRSFSQVVQQEPEEYDAWANVAAIHMRMQRPADAYPALIEALKYNRRNWRVWTTKLYACLDLQKWDEAVQACETLLDLRRNHGSSNVNNHNSNNNNATDAPVVEERCVRAIVGGSLQGVRDSTGDPVQLDSARRTLSRVHALLDRLAASSEAAPWVFETTAYLEYHAGGDQEQVLENRLKEYRACQAIPQWEKDDALVAKMSRLVLHIGKLYQSINSNSQTAASRQNLSKARFLMRGVVQQIDKARPGDKLPDEVDLLRQEQQEVEAQLKSL